MWTWVTPLRQRLGFLVAQMRAFSLLSATSFCHQFLSPVFAASWDARRWLVVDSPTSPTYPISFSCWWCGHSMTSSDNITSATKKSGSRSSWAPDLGPHSFSTCAHDREFALTKPLSHSLQEIQQKERGPPSEDPRSIEELHFGLSELI